MDSIDLIVRLVNAAIASGTLDVDDKSPISNADLQLEQMSGGDTNDAAIVWARGQTLFAKWSAQGHAPRESGDVGGRPFSAEAEGLARLHKGAPSLGIPRVFSAIDDDAGGGLLLEYFEGGVPVDDFDGALGRGLAELHRTTDSRGFGFDGQGYCGPTAFDNDWSSSWIDFYREKRLIPLIDFAQARGMPPDDVTALRGLMGRLDALLVEEPSALIHGDLWSGNQVIAPDGRPALVDPAAFFAHRELELGMMTLFGGFSERVFDAYDDNFPLADGWRDRLPLYELFHVLNHYHIFGGAYGMQAARTARKYL